MTPDPDLIRSYLHETEPGPGMVDRVVVGARGRVRAPARWSRALVPLLAAGAAVAVGLALRPAPPEAPPQALWSPDTLRTTDAGHGIALTWRGGGSLLVDQLTWESGEVSVEVPPDRGLHFVVTTREAEVRVVGTGFTVSRDVLGTRVTVRHGRVAVRCAGAPETLLGPGEADVCLPTSAPGLLARAGALRAADASAADVRVTLDAGMALAPGEGTVADELRYLRAQTAYDVGDDAAAILDLDALLAHPASIRRVEALRLRAGIAVRAGDCPSARPWLDELVAGEPRAVDLLLRAGCAPQAPAARADLERALALNPDPTTAARARAALENLPSR